MKYLTSISIMFIAFLSAISFAGCHQDGCTDPEALNYNPDATRDDGTCIPFQGPKNPSFDIGVSGFSATPWVRDDENSTYSSGGTIQTGTGGTFMPTQGQHYLQMASGYYNEVIDGHSQQISILYQDNVDLSHSSKMTFDYEIFIGSLDKSRVYPIEMGIYFIGNTTTTLWKKVFNDSNQIMPVQKIGEILNVAGLGKGRLTFKMRNYNSVGLEFPLRWNMDNFKVQ